eukprot:UN21868
MRRLSSSFVINSDIAFVVSHASTFSFSDDHVESSSLSEPKSISSFNKIESKFSKLEVFLKISSKSGSEFSSLISTPKATLS